MNKLLLMILVNDISYCAFALIEIQLKITSRVCWLGL